MPEVTYRYLFRITCLDNDGVRVAFRRGYRGVTQIRIKPAHIRQTLKAATDDYNWWKDRVRVDKAGGYGKSVVSKYESLMIEVTLLNAPEWGNITDIDKGTFITRLMTLAEFEESFPPKKKGKKS